jgi:hypothetical protein
MALERDFVVSIDDIVAHIREEWIEGLVMVSKKEAF